MSAWDRPRPPGDATVPLSEFVLSCLSHGSVAAARYPADLAALRTLSQSAPPVAVVAPDSRAAEYVAVHLAGVENGNSCGEGCGGFIATELAEITYEDDPPVEPQTGSRTDGYMNEIPFQADDEAGVGLERRDLRRLTAEVIEPSELAGSRSWTAQSLGRASSHYP